MFKFQKGRSHRYLKQLLVALIVVGLLGMYIIPQNVTYGGQGEKNKVEFYDFNSVLISSDNVDFGTGATPPPDDAANMPEGYEFRGWDKDFSYVTSTLAIWPLPPELPGTDSETESEPEQEPQIGLMSSPGGTMSVMDTLPGDTVETNSTNDELTTTSGPDWADLKYFINPKNGLIITDLNGAIPKEYYIGEEYIFNIGYSYPQDVVIDGVECFARPDMEAEFLYYQLPAGVAVRSDGILEGKLTKTVKNAQGQDVQEEIPGALFWIIPPTADNPITEVKVQLPTEMKNAGQGGFSLNFNASFDGSSGEGAYKFKDGISVDVISKPTPPEPPIVVTDDSEMTISKACGDYDHENQSITYTIKINATKGNPKFNHTYDWIVLNHNPSTVLDHRDNPVTINKTTLNGTSILTDTFPEIAYYNTWHGEGCLEFWFTDKSKGSDFGLKQGDELIIEYTVSIGEPGGLLDKAGFGYNLNLTNNAMAFHDDVFAGPATSPTTYIKRDFEKRAEYYEAPNGDRSIKWTIYIGDGKTDLRGMTIEDILDPRGLDAENVYNVLLKYYGEFDLAAGGINGAVLKEYKNPSMKFDELFDPVDNFVIGDFYDDKTKPIYYVYLEFVSKIADNLAPKFSNGIVFDGTYTSGTAGHTGVPGVFKDITKTGNLINDAGIDYLEWDIDYTVPAGIQGSALWFYDRMMIGSFVPFNNKEALLADGVIVTITNSDFPNGKELEEGTDYVLKSNGSEAWEMHFIDPDSNSGKWPYSSETKINITYRLNLDNALAAGGGTIRDALKAVASNNGGAQNTVSANIILPGYDGENGYTITVTDNDTVKYPINKGVYEGNANEIQYYIDINIDGKYSLPDEPLIIKDTFNSDILVYNGNLIVQKFDAGSNAPIGTYTAGPGAEATIKDNRNGTSTITFDLGASYWSEPWYTPGPDHRYRIYYNMKQKDNALPGVYEVKNTAGVNNNSYTSTTTTTVGTPIATKNMVGDKGADAGSQVDVELIFNEDKKTYSEGMPYLAEDVMSENLFLREETIVFEKKTAAGGWEKIDATYTYLDHNLVNFMIPDRETVRVTYSAYVLGSNGQQPSIGNKVTVFGHGYEKKIDNFKLQRLSGDAYMLNKSFSMLKRDSLSGDLMSGITFAVYINKKYNEYNANDPRWAGVDETLKVINGVEYRIIDVGTTGSDGYIDFGENKWFSAIEGVVFAVFEISSPDGYIVPAVTASDGTTVHEGLVRMFTFDMDTITSDKGSPYQVFYSNGPVGIPNEPKNTDVTISGTKRVEGIDGTDHSGYKFKLTEVTDQTGATQKFDVVPLAGLVTTSQTGGAFSFASIPNLRVNNDGSPKTYYFKVAEVMPDDPIAKMVYDDAPRIVKVTVSRGENDALDVQTDWLGKGNTFVNKLMSASDPVSVDLKAIKKTEGASLSGTNFQFVLVELVDDETSTTGEKKSAAQYQGVYDKNNSNEGYVTFPTADLTFSEPGIYDFIMYEGVTGNQAWVKEDADGRKDIGYYIQITIEESADRTLSKTVEYKFRAPWNDSNTSWSGEWIEYDENSGLKTPVFSNIYTPKSTQAEIVADKSVTGTDLKGGQFMFALLDNSGKVVDLATNAADGKITFKTETYTKIASEIKYTVVECGPASETKDWKVGESAGTYKTTSAGGWTYDTAKYSVSVEVADNEGDLEANVTYPDGSIAFENEFAPDPVAAAIKGSKVITGVTGSDKEFTFRALEVESATSAEAKSGGINETATIKGQGDFSIDLGKLGVGVYHFIVSEDQTGAGEGWTYDASTFRVTVTVTNNNGALTVSYANTPSELKFTNTYTAGKAKASIDGTKAITGVTGNSTKAFTFRALEVESADSETAKSGGINETATINGQGDFSIDLGELDAGIYYFLVSEDQTGDGADGWTYDNNKFRVTVTVTDTNGQAKADYEYATTAPKFTNTYKAGKAEASIDGTKTITGIADSTKSFTFRALEVDSATGTTAKSGGIDKTATRSGDGKFSIALGELDAGVYHFIVTEDQTGADAGWTYDNGSFRVTVTVTDTNGKATVAYAYSVTDPGFTNKFTPDPVAAAIKGNKTITGVTGSDKEFTFSALEVESAGSTTAKSGGIKETATIKGAGDFNIDLGKFEEGVYHFIVSEDQTGAGEGWAYDEITFRVTVTVTNDNKGALAVAYAYANGEPKFTNTYTAGKAEASIVGNKTITGVTGSSSKEFKFRALEVESATSETAKSGGIDETATINGQGDFNIELGELDAGVYHFIVSEDQTGADRDGWTYDKGTFRVTVTVTDTNGIATVVYAYSVEDPGFTNTYKSDPTDAKLTVDKALNGIEDTDVVFNFTAVQVDADGNVIAGGKTGIGSVGGEGSADIEIKDLVPGTYYFLITEDTGNAGGFVYSKEEILATVVVVDNGDGTSTASDPTYSPEENVITNDYEAKPADVTLTVIKALTGIENTDETFGFTAVQVDADGNVIAGGKRGTGSVGGAGNADIEIEDLVPGTYYFLITEDTGNAGGFAYSEETILATVVVEDNGDGTSSALEPTYRQDAQTFTNAYSADGSLPLEGIKTINEADGATWPEEEFTFTVTDVTDEDNTSVVATGVSNVVDGAITFDPIAYILNEETDETGRYIYVISEDARGEEWTAKTADITIYVEVVDDGKGNLTVTAYSDEGYSIEIEDISTLLTFDNEYSADGSITLEGNKVLGISVPNVTASTETTTHDFVRQNNQTMIAGQFKFSVMEGTKEVATGQNLANGTIEFTEIEYTLADLGLHTYVIKEIDTGLGFNAFNENFTVYVMVTDNFDGTLSVRVAGDPADFDAIEDTEGEGTEGEGTEGEGTEGEGTEGEGTEGEGTEGEGTEGEGTEGEGTEGEGTGNTANVTEAGLIVFENARWYDAALRKWVSNVNNSAVLAGDVKASVDQANLGEESPAVKVEKANYVEYTIRVFNQCPWPLQITGVVDSLPDGLGFVSGDADDENSVNAGWSLVGGQLVYDGDIPLLSPEIARFVNEPGYAGFDFGFTLAEQEDNPYYYDLKLILEVLPTAKAGVPITNYAMITGIEDEDGNEVEDVDSVFDPENDLDKWTDDDADNDVEGDGLKGGSKGRDRDEHDRAIIYIEGRISVEVDKDTIKRTSAAFDGTGYDVMEGENGEIMDNVRTENYRYDINFRSTSNIDVDEFVVYDPLEAVNAGMIRIENVWTPATWGDLDGKMAVWYKAAKGDASSGIDIQGDPGVTKIPTGGAQLFPTKRSDGWRLWIVITGENWSENSPIIDRVNIGLPFAADDDDYITALRFEFGAVQVGFTSKNGDGNTMNNGVRNTNGAASFYGNVIKTAEAPDPALVTPPAENMLYTDTAQENSLMAFAAEPFLQDAPSAFRASEVGFFTQSTANSDIPPKGSESDWGPEKGRSDFPGEPRNLTTADLKPATYLTSAFDPMMENEEIVTSVTAYIALNGAIEEKEAAEKALAKKTADTYLVLYDYDQDAVLTRVIEPIVVDVVEPVMEELETTTTFLEDAKLAGLHRGEDGVWYDASGSRVKTGDMFAISLWVILLACAALCMVFLIRTFVAEPGKKKKKEILPESGKGGGL